MSFQRGMRLFRGQEEFHLDIVGRRRWWFALSGVLIVISIVGLFTPGLNLGIDFTGGALLEYPNRTAVGWEPSGWTYCGPWRIRRGSRPATSA
jgi:hypothetical protein